MRVHIAILGCALSVVAASSAGAQQAPSNLSAPPELESSAAGANAVADPRQTELLAAQANAADALREVVLSLEVGRGLRVRDLVDRTNSTDTLGHALAAARPLGGPRWIDDQTCQVQMAVPGAAVADAVAAMLARYPGGHPPIRPDLLNGRLSGWRRTAFSATGYSAAGGAALQQVRPRQSGGRWAEVSDDDRRRALAAAQADAVGQASADLRRAADPLATRARLVEVLDRPAVVTRVRAFLDAQPVTSIEFHDDLTVSLSMTVDGAGLGRAAERAATEDQPRVSAAIAADWDRFRDAVVRVIPPSITGTAAAAAVPPTGVAPTGLPVVVLPVQPPDWVDGVLTAGGSALPPGAPIGRLKVKGLADAAAVAQLRSKLLALRVGPAATLGDAARADPQLAAAVSRVLLDARESRVDFHADGSVEVVVNLNLRDAWDQLRSNP